MSKHRRTVNFILILLVTFILASRAFTDYDRFRSVSDDVVSLLHAGASKSAPLSSSIRNSGPGAISYVVETERLRSSGTVSALLRQTSRRPAFDAPSAIVFLFLLSCLQFILNSRRYYFCDRTSYRPNLTVLYIHRQDGSK